MAPAFFQQIMDKVVRPLEKEKVECYIDDLIIKGTSFEQHLRTTKEVLQKLSDAGLMVSLAKSHFLHASVNYLGYLVSSKGLLPGERKVKAVRMFPVPISVKQVQGFIGLCSFFRKFVPNFSCMAYPLLKLMHKDVLWEWGPMQTEAFEQLKTALTSTQMLTFADPSKPFYLHCDASIFGLGICLMQKDDKLSCFRPVGYASRALLD